MLSFVLETFYLCVSHTAENIAAELLQIADEWNITEKVVAIVTNNSATWQQLLELQDGNTFHVLPIL